MSGTQSLRGKAGLEIQQQTPDSSFPAILMKFKEQLATALPRHMNADRMARIALTAFRQNPGLAECEPKSIFASCIVASQLGLEIGVLGHAYLVPYTKSQKINNQWVKTKECQLIPGWRGLVDLVNRAGKASVWTEAVYKGDKFEYTMGTEPKIVHERGDSAAEVLTHVYAVGRVKGSEFATIDVWPVSKVRAHLTRYNKVGDRHYALTDGGANFEMYARKVALLQVLKYMPLSIEMAQTYELDSAAESGSQNLTIDGAVKGEFLQPDTTIIDAETEDSPASGNGGFGFTYDPTSTENPDAEPAQ